jgi:pyruvate,water dikinase
MIRLLSYAQCLGEPASSVGGKTRALARLAASGLPVPDGFCIAGWEGALSRGERERLAGAVASLGARSGAARFAVRSSASVEDAAERSFAGLFLSRCDVSAGDVPAAALACREGIRRGSFAGYGASGRAAVLVQQMIGVRVGGVAFGCDPVSGRGGVVTVEYAAGPTSGIVGGELSPERLQVPKGRGRLRLEPGEAAPWAREAVAALLGVFGAVEELLGAPQDVEWGWDGERLWLLQARPVTAAPSPDWDRAWRFGFRESGYETDAEALWTTANVGEAIPGVVTPLTSSLIEVLQDHVFGEVMRWTPVVHRRGDSVFGAVHGRVCLCLSSILACRAPGMGISAEFLSRQIGAPIARLPAIPAREAAEYLWRLPTRLLPALLLPLRMRGAGRSLRRQALRLSARLRRTDPRALSAGELLGESRECVRTANELFFWHTVNSMASSGLTHLCEALVAGRAGEGGGAGELSRVLGDLRGVESAGPGRALRRIARRRGRAARALGLVALDWAEAQRALPATAAGRGLRGEIEEFLARYGFRGVNEAELFGPRWEERPAEIWNVLRALMSQPARPRGSAGARGADEAGRLAAGVPRLVRPALRSVIRLTRDFLRLRENTRAAVTSLIGQLRRLASEAGARLAAGGRIGSAADVFYLTWPELQSALEGRDSDGEVLTARVQRRRRRRAYWLSRPPLPVVFSGDRAPEPGVGGARGRASDGAVLRGIPVSAGRVGGVARVLTEPDTSRLRPGEILVVPYLNPGWGPVLTLAGGVIAETGGMMSHGAIIARELGVPAVVGVSGARGVIGDGRAVELDGGSGTVRLLSAGRSSSRS